jgi:PhnB protein
MAASCSRTAFFVRCYGDIEQEGVALGSRLNPYLSFNGNARQAMEFYQKALGGKLTVNTYGEYGDPSAPEANNLMHGQLETDAGFTLMGADNPPGMPYDAGSNFAVSLSGEDLDELKGYWEKLSQGATIEVPLEKQMWGDEFGQLTDQFGVKWMVNAGEPRD